MRGQAAYRRSLGGYHPLLLFLEPRALGVTYSSSGCHSSGWKSGFRKCAVLKCELHRVSSIRRETE